MEEDLRTIFNEGSSPSPTESTVAAERMERRNLLEPLPEPSTFFLRLLSSLFLSVSLSRDLSAWCSLCVFTEIGEAAGCYFPADSVGRLQRLQILLRFSEPLSPAKPFAQFPLLLISFQRGERRGTTTTRNRESKGHSKKDGARGGSMNFRPGKKLPPL